jgi:23S rRNA (cytosine1962-C5)-methyltransferase
MRKRVTATLRLKKGRDKPVRNRHPWIFSGAVEAVAGESGPGDLVEVRSADGSWLACAYINPRSQIRARILSWNPQEEVDESFWHARLAQSVAGRRMMTSSAGTTAYRLVNAEADGLPGLIVDKYGDFLVFQCLTAGIDCRKEVLVSWLADNLSPVGIVERSDVRVRALEGLSEVSGVRWGEKPPAEHIILENNHRFAVNLIEGHKTGLYLDQRVNRPLVCQEELVAGREVLNVFAYTGGFALYAAAAGASAIVNVDDSADFLAQAEANIRRNDHDRPQDEYIVGDAFQVLRHYRDLGRRFDMVILDPPKFAHRQRDIPAACRGYKDLNWLAMRLLRADGLLATFSCSGLVSADLFQKVLFGASVDAGRDVQILNQLSQAPDHPVLLSFPESAYLKGFLCRVI